MQHQAINAVCWSSSYPSTAFWFCFDSPVEIIVSSRTAAPIALQRQNPSSVIYLLTSIHSHLRAVLITHYWVYFTHIRLTVLGQPLVIKRDPATMTILLEEVSTKLRENSKLTMRTFKKINYTKLRRTWVHTLQITAKAKQDKELS